MVVHRHSSGFALSIQSFLAGLRPPLRQQLGRLDDVRFGSSVSLCDIRAMADYRAILDILVLGCWLRAARDSRFQTRARNHAVLTQ
jgi:hypothetical protein